MKPIVWLLAGLGGLWLLARKQEEAFNTATNDWYVPPNPAPSVTPTKPTVKTNKAQPATANTSPLSVAENDLLNGGSPDAIYNAAMRSSNIAFVTMAGNQLAEAGDTRAGDLTLRIANWNA
jgi:hypothetical protein